MANSPQRQRPGFLETETFHKVMKRLSAAHVLLYRRSKGRIGATMPVTATQWLPVCLLTHTGRRSGLRRVTPLLNLADGERVVLLPLRADWIRTLSGTATWSLTRIAGSRPGVWRGPCTRTPLPIRSARIFGPG